MLNARWQDAEPLEDLERRDVLRAAIGYSIANDTLGLERLRRKYTSKMASSPDASSFEVVTGTVERDGAAIDALAREIASIDTLEAFLDDFRSRYGASDGADGVATPASQGSDAGI
jgi:hypothetical protein